MTTQAGRGVRSSAALENCQEQSAALDDPLDRIWTAVLDCARTLVQIAFTTPREAV
jgi:hypothetical protein